MAISENLAVQTEPQMTQSRHELQNVIREVIAIDVCTYDSGDGEVQDECFKVDHALQQRNNSLLVLERITIADQREMSQFDRLDLK